MPHYLNPAISLLSIARKLKPSGSYRGYAEQLSPDEHLFCLAYRGREKGEYPQAAYIWDAMQYREYCDSLFNCYGVDGFYALPQSEWDKNFNYVPDRYAQQRY